MSAVALAASNTTESVEYEIEIKLANKVKWASHTMTRDEHKAKTVFGQLENHFGFGRVRLVRVTKIVERRVIA